MSGKTLFESTNFNGSDLYVNGNKVFTVPVQRHTMNGIRVVGLSSKDDFDDYTLYIGTGACCNGHLYELEKYCHLGAPILNGIYAPDLCVSDICAIRTDPEKTGMGNGFTVLVCGTGCSGRGVRLMGTSVPNRIVILSTEEYETMVPGGAFSRLRFRLEREQRSLYLDFMVAGFRVKPGKQRDPKMPSILADPQAEEVYVSDTDRYASIDLTPRLLEYGADLDYLCEVPFRRINA